MLYLPILQFLEASIFLLIYAVFVMLLANHANKKFSLSRAVLGFFVGALLATIFLVLLVDISAETFQTILLALVPWGMSGAIILSIEIPLKDLHPVNIIFTRKKIYLIIATGMLMAIWIFYMPNLIQLMQIIFRVTVNIVIVVLIVWGFMVLMKKRREPTIIKHNSDSLAEASLQDKEIAAMSNSNGVWCGQHNGKNIFVSTQDRGIVIGPPGAGKTSFLIMQLLKWIETKRSFVCLDNKLEIHSVLAKRLAELDYNVFVYNPSIETSLRYNLFDDMDNIKSIEELIYALIPSPDPRNKAFHENARDFLDAIISHLHEEHKANLPEIRELLKQFNNHKELFTFLCKSSSKTASELAKGLSMFSSEHRLGSIFSIMRSNLRFLRHPTIRRSLESSDFSLKALTRKQPAAIFLQFEKQHQEVTGKLLSVMLGHIIHYLMKHQDREAVLLLLDEIGNVPPIQGLKEKLNGIRKHKMPTWLYWQNIGQMEKYTQKENGVNNMLGACDLQMVFRLNDNRSASWISQRIGLVDRVIESRAVQRKGLFKLSASYTKNIVTEPKVKPHELQQLENGKALCIYHNKFWLANADLYFEIFPEYKTDTQMD